VKDRTNRPSLVLHFAFIFDFLSSSSGHLEYAAVCYAVKAISEKQIQEVKQEEATTFLFRGAFVFRLAFRVAFVFRLAFRVAFVFRLEFRVTFVFRLAFRVTFLLSTCTC